MHGDKMQALIKNKHQTRMFLKILEYIYLGTIQLLVGKQTYEGQQK